MERKKNYVNTVINLSQEYNKIMIAECNNVGSTQIQAIRKALRGKGVVLMGKNTMIKKAIELNKDANPKLYALKKYVKDKVALIFTNSDLKEIRDTVYENRVSAPAKAGQISKVEVVIPAQNTGMEPTATSFFQALNIPTKITKGAVEIINDYTILTVGQKVGNSEAILLQKLNINPFSYGFIFNTIYDDGVIYSPDVLDLSESVLESLLGEAVQTVASISLGANYTTAASVQSEMINALKDVLAVSVAANFKTPENEKVLEYLEDPSKFAVATVTTKVESKSEDKVEEKEDTGSESGGGFGLFGEEEED
eukprot:gene11321-4133_t